MSRKFFNQFKTGQKAFTIIELLVITVILGVIASIVILNIVKFTGTGDLAAAQAEVHSINTALGAYFADNHAKVALDQEDFSEAVIPYLNHPNIKGTYTSDINGTITGISYHTFNWSNGTWNK